MTLYKITEQKLYYFGYSTNTVKSYLHYVSEFEDSIKKHYSRITSKDIQSFLDSYSFKSRSQQNQIISSLKFAWEKGLSKKYIKIDFKRPRKQKKLPIVVDKDYIISRISTIKNLKHKAIIQLAFSTGMRVSEVINLRIKDIDSSRMLIHIKNAKGRKDRIVKLTESTLFLLRAYYREFKPFEFMFNGQLSAKYSPSSCNKIVKKYFGESFHFHLLRHSSLTSMIENGTDVSIVQRIAGHNSLNTTMGYVHVSNKTIGAVCAPI